MTTKSFRTKSGEKLYMQWTDATHELTARMNAFHDIHRASAVHDDDFDATTLAQTFQEACAKKLSIGIDVVDSKNKLRGMILYTPPQPENMTADLTSIWCDPAYRKQGVGSRMMRRALAHMRALGTETVYSGVGITNSESFNFLLKNKWSFTGEIEDLGTAIYMVCGRPLRMPMNSSVEKDFRN